MKAPELAMTLVFVTIGIAIGIYMFANIGASVTIPPLTYPTVAGANGTDVAFTTLATKDDFIEIDTIDFSKVDATKFFIGDGSLGLAVAYVNTTGGTYAAGIYVEGQLVGNITGASAAPSFLYDVDMDYVIEHDPLNVTIQAYNVTVGEANFSSTVVKNWYDLSTAHNSVVANAGIGFGMISILPIIMAAGLILGAVAGYMYLGRRND